MLLGTVSLFFFGNVILELFLMQTVIGLFLFVGLFWLLPDLDLKWPLGKSRKRNLCNLSRVKQPEATCKSPAKRRHHCGIT